MTFAEKKISAFCARHRIAYEWQHLKYNGQCAVVESVDRKQHNSILTHANRLKGVHVTDWTCDAGGAWSGYIYLQAAQQAESLYTTPAMIQP